MRCLHCEEMIEPLEDDVLPVNDGTGWMHRACLLRSVIGSEDHVRRGKHPATVSRLARPRYREISLRQLLLRPD